MNFITKNELEKKDIVSKFELNNGSLTLPGDCEYKSSCDVGDIVVSKNNMNITGVVSFIDEDEVSINWNDNSETTENMSNLIILPPTIGLKLLKDTTLIKLWEELSNGKSDSFDLKCIYLNDKVINEVPFIKAFKNTSTLVDKKFKRSFALYRKFGNTQIYRTNLYTISSGEIKFDTNKFVYYLLENNVVYYLGINLNEKDLVTYLFNR